MFALLVLACFAAFFLTQRLKHTPTAVQRFQPVKERAQRDTVGISESSSTDSARGGIRRSTQRYAT